MSMPTREEVLKYFPPTDDPERRARRRQIIRLLVEMEPEVLDELIEQDRQQSLAFLIHLFERRLERRLSDDERRTVDARLRALGSARIGDVVFDLPPEAIATWLADPDAR